MVQLMSSAMADSTNFTKKTVKFELHASSDSLQPIHKRPKLLSSSFQENSGGEMCSVSSSKYNPLDEPSPLGLSLRKSPSLLELIQMKLSQDNAGKVTSLGKKGHKGSAVPGALDKLKASNFPGSVLKIGTWQYKSRYEGDLVAKCYFAKHKLVWEVLDGSLKNKIEIQWSDIVALKAIYPEDAVGTLNVVLARPPLFFRETNPQPRKHTLWQTTSDFTGGQASMHRQHFLQCPPGMIGKHFEKLIQCDPRLHFLSQQPETVLESSYFEPRATNIDEGHEISQGFDLKTVGPAFFNLQDATTSSGADSSSRNEQDITNRTHESYSSDISSPISELKNREAETSKTGHNWDQVKVPGLHPSMSVSDLVSHIEHCISEKMTPGKPQNDPRILEEINNYLFSDTQLTLASDEQSLMSRVNSLCCLLQRAPSTTQLFNPKNDTALNAAPKCEAISEEGKSVNGIENSGDVSVCKQGQEMSRKDSFGDLLLNLPRIASLPQFLFNLAQDSNNQAR